MEHADDPNDASDAQRSDCGAVDQSPCSEECKPRLYAGRLEIAREPGTREAHAYCPYRATMLRVSECFACNDCDGLAIDGCGKHSYVVCARAARDGVATEAWYDQTDAQVPVVAVRTTFVPPNEED
jgi:hypothetical protein